VEVADGGVKSNSGTLASGTLVSGTGSAHASRTAITLTPSQPLRANTEIEFALTIRDAQINQPVAELEPFLGPWAHFVIIDNKHTSFIHAHPLEAVQTTAAHVHDAASLGPPPETIRTLTSFPHAGVYKLWAQFQRNGEVITQPFVLHVAAAEKTTAPVAAIPLDAIKLNVSANGFAPFKLAITRGMQPNCANKILFPSLGLNFALPLGQTTVIELPALPTGELSFSCGMGMYKGVLMAN
jgi:hypothetical protein